MREEGHICLPVKSAESTREMFGRRDGPSQAVCNSTSLTTAYQGHFATDICHHPLSTSCLLIDRKNQNDSKMGRIKGILVGTAVETKKSKKASYV